MEGKKIPFGKGSTSILTEYVQITVFFVKMQNKTPHKRQSSSCYIKYH